MHNPINMVNEPGKMSNLNTLHLRWYVDRWKKTEWQTRTEIWIPLQSWWFPSRKNGTSLLMVRFMKGVHDDISQAFSNYYQGMVRSYHGTMPGVMFFKHLFHFFYSWKPSKQTFVVDLPHISLKYLSIPCKRHENLLNGMSIIFQTVLVHPFMHWLFELELCALMPRKCT